MNDLKERINPIQVVFRGESSDNQKNITNCPCSCGTDGYANLHNYILQNPPPPTPPPSPR
jgi:hypothetical protein